MAEQAVWPFTMKYFLCSLDGQPHALVRILGQRADRLLPGGEWEEYPDLVRLLFVDDWGWDEINAADAKRAEAVIRAQTA